MRYAALSFILLVVLLFAFQIQAQDSTCDFENLDDYVNDALDALDNGDYKIAIDFFTCMIEIDPGYALAYTGRGLLYAIDGDFDAALADLNTSIELDPEIADAYIGRAWVHMLRGDASPHMDFMTWVVLTETESLDGDLFELMNAGNLPIEEGYVYRFSFEGSAGQVFGAAALSDDPTDPLLILLDGNGMPITSDDDGGINLNAVIQNYTLAENGAYTLVLAQAGGAGAGEVELATYLDGVIQSTDPDNANIAANFAVYNLYIDETAEVFTTGGDRLNVREAPGLDSPVVAQVAAGELVTLLAGSVKVDGYSWWQIRLPDGSEGWAVERVETEQTLQLALIPGEDAIVRSGTDLLNVREGAGRDFNVLYQLEDGAVVTLLDEAPVLRDNLRWWHIRDADGREGWTVDRIGIERVLAPAREFKN